MRRDSIFVGIGRGITLDVVGFSAFMFRRKTKYIRIPTTLVGLVNAVLVDEDKNGKVLGIEILDATENIKTFDPKTAKFQTS